MSDADIEGPGFHIGDPVVGNVVPMTYGVGGIMWIPEPKGFDALCRVRNPVGRLLKNMAMMAMNLARGYAPIDTGLLRSSIAVHYGKWPEGIYADIGTDVYYGPFQEFGTSRNPEHPYLRPALADAVAHYTNVEASEGLDVDVETWTNNYGPDWAEALQ